MKKVGKTLQIWNGAKFMIFLHEFQLLIHVKWDLSDEKSPKTFLMNYSLKVPQWVILNLKKWNNTIFYE